MILKELQKSSHYMYIICDAQLEHRDNKMCKLQIFDVGSLGLEQNVY